MTDVTVIKGNIVTPKEVLYGGHVVVVGDRIVGLADNSVPLPTVAELSTHFANPTLHLVTSGGFVVPGFVDIHNHGLGGHPELVGHWSNPEFSLRELARCGTLTTLASLIFPTGREQLVEECIRAVEERVGKHITDCCELGGIHAEGPIIQDRGGLPASDARASLTAFKALCATMPSLRVMTISPHIDAQLNYARIRHLLSIKVRPALGHDRVATKAEILGALRLASSEEDKLHVTHLYNVMTFHHRNASLVNLSLCARYPKAAIYKDVKPPTVELIADLVHSDATTVQTALCCRATRDVAIITDCISEHKPGKRLSYNGRESVVRAEGACYLCDALGRPSTTLAGSTSMLADLFLNLISLFGVELTAACQHVATVPARIARLGDVGAIEVGKKAHLLLLNAELNTIERRMVGGEWTSHGPYRMLRPSVSHM